MTFLEEVAQHVLQSPYKMYEIQIVLPSKRAALFLSNAFKKQTLKNSFFFPDIITINEFIDRYTSYSIADSNTLLFEFYKVYTEFKKEQAEPFDSFIKWAPSLLNDFSEIDRYLVDPNAIFSDLRNIKELENWSFNNEELSGSQINYLEFWHSILPLYNALSEQLMISSTITSAKSYRLFAESIQETAKEIKSKKIYFVGFNALSKSEFIIIKTLKTFGIAEVIFDIDEYYIKIQNHEAGYFFRKLINEFEIDKKCIKSNLVGSKESINVISSPNDFSQARVVSELVNSNHQFLNSNSAIVLSDETLLLPLINEMPSIVNSANVTMGYPSRLTLTANFFERLFTMHENSQKYSSKNVSRFYYSDLFAVLEHPVLKNLGFHSDKFKSYCVKRNLSFINFQEVLQDVEVESEKGRLTEFIGVLINKIGFLFEPWDNDAIKISTSCNKLIDLLKGSVEISELEKEALFTQWRVFNKILSIYNHYSFLNDSKYFKKIYRSLINNEQIALVGEPLEGVQLIGMLETRLIDYENIIITSVNEGVVPKSKIDTSIIPYDLKRHFGLPTYKERDAIYAYYFYRLLHRSKNVWLVYNSDTEGFSSGEYSRYILQLKHEFSRKDILKFEQVAQSSVFNQQTSLVFVKDDFYYQRLENLLFERGLSPSAINVWLNCPRDFYIKYILGIREQDEVEEEIGDNVLGTVIHGVLETLYRPFVGKVVTANDIVSFKKSYLQLLEKFFKNEYSRFYKTGKNYIAFNIACKLLEAFFDNEIKLLNNKNHLKILGLEQKLESKIVVDTAKGTKAVKIKGVVDRIDVLNGVVRISDYKTGGVEEKNVTIKDSLNELINKNEKQKALQLFMYALMYSNNDNSIKHFTSQIITLRDVKNCYYPLSYKSNILLSQNDVNEFKFILTEIINQMYSEDFPIEHNPKHQYCIMCE